MAEQQWMQQLAEVEDAATAAEFQAGDQAPSPVAKAPPPVVQEPPAAPIPVDDAPTEPATSPRQIDPEAREWPVQLQLPSREYGPQEEPERYATRFVVNDGQWTPEEHEVQLRQAPQATNTHLWNREARESAERANREYAPQMEDWRARVEAAGFKATPAVPQGPPPKGVSSSRVLPNVHEALRPNDPTSKAPSTQPSLPKKAPPTTGQGIPAGFYRVEEPPRIGSGQIQPAPLPKRPGSTPTTPAHPPRPPISALPQPVQEPPAPATLKHPLPQPAQQGPPNKQGRSKDFPRDPRGNPLAPMPAAPAVDRMRVGAPIPKSHPASCVPTPSDVLAPQPMDTCAAAALPGQDDLMASDQKSKKLCYVHSPSDIDWHFPLKDQLEPQLTCPDSKKTFEELCFLRNRIPKMDDDGFQKIFPGTKHCIL